jgi:hypothetical protein
MTNGRHRRILFDYPTFIFNRIWARPLVTMVAKTASISAAAANKERTNR